MKKESSAASVSCTLVFKRECTAKEKGDVLVWLGGIK